MSNLTDTFYSRFPAEIPRKVCQQVGAISTVVRSKTPGDDSAAEKLSNILYSFVTRNGHVRIGMRYKSEDIVGYCCWNNLYPEYRKADEVGARNA